LVLPPDFFETPREKNAATRQTGKSGNQEIRKQDWQSRNAEALNLAVSAGPGLFLYLFRRSPRRRRASSTPSPLCKTPEAEERSSFKRAFKRFKRYSPQKILRPSKDLKTLNAQRGRAALLDS
jgi:hypothetical protein